MDTKQNMTETFSETQSLKVIQEMIQTAKNRHNQDGVLFIFWGWLMVVWGLWLHIPQNIVVTSTITDIVRYLNPIFPLGGLAFTIIYLVRRNRQIKSYIGRTLLYVWLGMLGCVVLSNLIDMNYINDMMNDTNTPFYTSGPYIQMLFIGFAALVTGLSLHHKLVVGGAIVFVLLAYAASFFDISYYFYFSTAGWIFGFIIPGHIIYSKRNG